MSSATNTRRKRFARSPHRHVRLTPDDLAIIGHVVRHRFLRSTHLVQLLPHRPAKKIVERMGQLYHAGFLDRPRAQLDYFDRAGSAPMVYAPGDRSTDVVPGTAGLEWKDKNRQARRPYIEHALAIADIMVAFDMAARRRKDLELLDAPALAALHQMPSPASRWSMTADVRVNGRSHTISTVPDAVFALRFRTFGRIAYFFLEVDRGTMSVNSADLSKSSYRRKLLGYHAALKAEQHVERFGFENARVLTVTTSKERVHSMIGVVNAISRSVESGRFLFVDMPSLAADDPLAILWTSQSRGIRIDTPPRVR